MESNIMGILQFEGLEYDKVRKTLLGKAPSGIEMSFFRKMSIDFEDKDLPGICISGKSDKYDIQELVIYFRKLLSLEGMREAEVSFSSPLDKNDGFLLKGHYYGIVLIPTVEIQLIADALQEFSPNGLFEKETIKNDIKKTQIDMFLDSEIEIEDIFLKLRKMSTGFGPIYHAELED